MVLLSGFVYLFCLLSGFTTSGLVSGFVSVLVSVSVFVSAFVDGAVAD